MTEILQEADWMTVKKSWRDSYCNHCKEKTGLTLVEGRTVVGTQNDDVAVA